MNKPNSFCHYHGLLGGKQASRSVRACTYTKDLITLNTHILSLKTSFGGTGGNRNERHLGPLVPGRNRVPIRQQVPVGPTVTKSELLPQGNLAGVSFLHRCNVGGWVWTVGTRVRRGHTAQGI